MSLTRFLKYFLLSLVVISAAHAMVSADTPFFQATANKSTVGLNEQFQVTFTVNGSARNFMQPNMSDFVVLSGPNQSSSIQFVNGAMSQSLSLSYILQPKAEGSFKIGPASIEVEGKRIASNVVNITVVKGNAPAAQAGRGQGGQAQADGADGGGLSSKNIFVRAIANKASVVQGEAVVVTFKIYTNVNIVNYTVSKMPAFNGCWNQEIELPQQLELTNENVDGINYKAGEIKKVVLFPQQDGTLTIDPMELECIARVQVKNAHRNDPFGMFNDPFFNDPFFGFGGARDVKYAFRSNPIKINVRALPAGAPAGFKGSVGHMQFEASLDKSETKADEPVALKIKISGNGNLKLADAPSFEAPQDFETYDPKVSDNLKTTAGGVSGTKTFEYLLIPRAEGSYTLDPLTFTYYDLEKGKYVTQTAGPFNIKVGRGNGQHSGTAVSIAKSDVQVLGNDIRYIKVKQPEFGLSAGNFYGSVAYYSLLLLPAAFFGGFAAYKRNRDRLYSNTSLLRARNATSIAQKRLQSAQTLLKSGNDGQVFDEISKALWGYVADKLTIPVSELSKDTISGQLAQRGVADQSVKEYLSILQDCEFARYGGTVAGTQAAGIYDRAHRLITQIEGELKA